jgi:hypothetical protein
MANKRGGRRRSPAGAPQASTSAPSPNALFGEVLRGARELLDLDDPLEAELWASGLLGTWYGMPLPGEDPDRLFGEGLVRYAGRKATPASLALLLALAAVGPDALAAKARTAADRLRGQGVPPPPWDGRVGQVEFTGAWVSGDHYGDQQMLAVGFAHAGRPPHSLAILIDHNLGGIAKDAFVSTEPDELAAAWDEQSGAGEMVRTEQLDAAGAAALLRGALEATDLYVDSPVTDDFREARAVAHARLRALPAADAAERGEVSAEQREAVFDAFGDSPEAAELEPSSELAFVVGSLIDFRCDHGDGEPLRWSPTQVELCLLDWFPRKVSADQDTLAQVPRVLRAFVRYAGRVQGLPAHLVEATLAAVGEFEKDYLEAIADPSRFGPAKAIAMAMRGDGVDFGDEAAVQAWIDAYNTRILARDDLGPSGEQPGPQ